jgi:hypothetical protein
MKKLCCVLLLASAGCVPSYSVRRVVSNDPPLSREEVERLSTAGVSDAVVNDMLEKRGAAPLTPDDLVALKKAGTPDGVVQKMIASERKPQQTVVVEDVYGYPGYGYYGYPYYPYYPTVSVGVGWGYGYGYGYGYGCGYGYGYPRGYMGVRAYR